METFQNCITTMKHTKNDSEKLASLLIVSKISSSLTFSEEMAKQLLQAITSRFLIRLMKTKETFSENDHIFFNIALNVIMLLLKVNPTVILSEGELIKQICSHFNDELTENNSKIMSSCITVLIQISDTAEGCDALQNNLVLMQLKKFLFDDQCSKDIYQLLSNLLNMEQNNIKVRNSFVELIDILSQEFKERHDLVKFQYIVIISRLFRFLHTHVCNLQEYDYQTKEILKNIQQATFDVLISKVKCDIKQSVIILLSQTVNVFGTGWLFDSSSTRQVQKFLLVCLTVISIEMNVLFRDEEIHEKDVMVYTDMVESSCTITKAVMSYLCSEEFEKSDIFHDSDFILKVMGCLKNILTPIYMYLKMIDVNSIQSLDNTVFKSIISLVSYWATEETDSLQEELHAILPLLTKFGQLEVQELTTRDGPVIYLNYLAPCISQLLPDQKARNILLQLEFHHVFIEYCIWLCTQTQVVDKSLENTVHLLHELVVIEKDLCSKDEAFVGLLNALKGIYISYVSNGAIIDYCKLELTALFFTLIRTMMVKMDSLIAEIFRFSYTYLFESLRGFAKHVNNNDTDSIWIIAAQNIADLALRNECLQKELTSSRAFKGFMTNDGASYDEYKEVFKDLTS